MIQWVWERVSATPMVDKAIVATDDERIATAVRLFGGEAMMTGQHHHSGTERCGEVVEKLKERGERYDVVINVQGDEPFVMKEQIETLINRFDNRDVNIATLRCRINSNEELMSANCVKVVCDKAGRAMYFSRQPIPYMRGTNVEEWLQKQTYWKHVGIYAFRADTLAELVGLAPTQAEESEKLEQLRWLENGHDIWVGDTVAANVGIDTPEDLSRAEATITKSK